MNFDNVENSWMMMPTTPGKPILARSKLIPAESTQNEASNWQELLGFYSGLLREETTTNGVAQPNSSPPATAAGAIYPAVVRELDIQISHDSPMYNSYRQIDASRDGFAIPYWPFNNLQTPLRADSRQASPGSSFRVAPVTPDLRKLVQNSQLCNIQHFPTDPSGQQNVESFPNESVPGIPKSSAGGVTASPGEDQPYLGGDYEGIDLNKTPNQRTPKRRKHRPKVVGEGKRKGSVNATAPLPNNENQPKKRKYVRRKNIQASPAQTENTAEKVIIPEVQSASMSCRRVLNFDLQQAADRSQDQIIDSETKEQEGELLFNMNSKYTNSDCRASASSTVMHPTNQMLPVVSSLLTPTANGLTLDVIERALSMQNARHYQPITQNGYNILGEGIGRTVQTNSCYGNTDTSALQQSINMFNSNGFGEQRRLKRAYYQTVDVPTHTELNPLNSSLVLSNQMDSNTTCYVGSTKISSRSLEIAENSKASYASYGNQTGLPAFTSSKTKETRGMHGIYASTSRSQYMERVPDPYLGQWSSLKKPMKEVNHINENRWVNQMAGDGFLKENAFPEVHRRDKQMEDKMLKRQTGCLGEIPSLNALVNVANSDLPSLGRHVQPTQRHDEIEMSKIEVPSKHQARRPIISKKATKKERVLSDHQNPDAGSRDQKVYLQLVDEVLEKLQGLRVNEGSAEIRGGDGNALVPYTGNGSVVPYKNNIKRRKPRAKVNLDPVTNRIWNLLMWKGGSESTENMDEQTEKRWEEERKVFRGRIDSFVARMHLVQGDRRFSPWKGSVVDSIIGVFLTQNVSDHLSSSAFMSLVAKFPPPSLDEEPHQNTSNVIVEEPVFYQSSTTSSETSEQQREDIMTGSSSGKKFWITEEEVISSQSSSDSFVYRAIEEVKSNSDTNSMAEDLTIEGNFHPDRNPKEHSLPHETNYRFQEHQTNVTNSPLTLDGPEFWYQIAEYLKDDGQNPGRGCATNDYLSNFMMMPFQGCDTSNSQPYLQHREVNLSESSGEGGMYSLPQVQEEKDHFSRHKRQMEERVNAAPGQVTRMKEILDLNVMQRPPPFFSSDSKSPLGPNTSERCKKPSMVHNRDTSLNTSEPTDTFSLRPAELTEGQMGNHGKTKAITNISNGRKRTIDGQMKETFDWDSLRRQVQPLGSTKERSKNAMDTIDYEKLKNTDVKVISDAIKERGMNNILADRIKDFLNRLVEEHGSIDLEWLRDVPPEKVKDYLLSIRGLGLKSVECVRLLALQNVAFPVDTNVARIAVRLGWVPLQPLPESLQLHLLEMYPVLDSVQKYLWPRLCKLDQKTLYELHYQMITFGKVFCTKSSPNCNACPMRAECRHFASAFASARLALPGPEERSIVSSVPVKVDDIPSMVIKPMLLPQEERSIISSVPVEVDDIPLVAIKPMLLPPEDYNTEERGPCSNEPIIEEPQTPEPSEKALESDIEDAFYDDTDEIPTINLNLEEFATNLQTFLQGQMEMQGEVSQALVAINPAASSTARQLKDVNRLRTEHYVYELPDSHPLLKGMRRREADDPSPYLLAIWTPGETSESFRPPESKCGNQASGSLCQEETCFSCNSIREAKSKIVRGTLLIPCRTALRGSFPLNGTYFQVNEMFADHASSLKPIDVRRELIWNLPRRLVYFGSSVTSIFRGLTTTEIQHCFWRGFVCVRGFEQKTRSPKPLVARMHFPVSKQIKIANEESKRKSRTQKEQQVQA